MFRSFAVISILISSASAQALYSFNALNGSDTRPFTLLDGQDNWSEQTFAGPNRCGVTATLGFDGTPCLRYQESGPGYGCDASRINDANWSFAPFTAGMRNAYFQADMQVGYWGGSFGLAYDTDNSGSIRGNQAFERGVRFELGTYTTVQMKLIGADGSVTQVPLAGLGISGGQWVRVRVVMDLTGARGAGLGYVDIVNLTAGETQFRSVSGLQAIPLGLDTTASDARNPTRWNALWLHFEGATYGLDNVEVGRTGFGRPYGAGCNGASGQVQLTANGVFSIGQTVMLTSTNHAPSAPGVVLIGFSNTTFAGVPLPLLVDPLLGTVGCSLLTSAEITLGATTSAQAPASLVFPLTIPGPTFGASFYTQHVCLEPVPGGVSFSNGLFVQLP